MVAWIKFTKLFHQLALHAHQTYVAPNFCHVQYIPATFVLYMCCRPAKSIKKLIMLCQQMCILNSVGLALILTNKPKMVVNF